MPPPRRRAPATRRNAPPAPRRNTRAVRTGAQANGENLPDYEKTRAEVEAVRAEAPWILRTDEPLLEVFAAELNAYRYTNVALARLGDTSRFKKVSAVKLQLRRARLLGELADRLGLSPQSRFKLGLMVAKAGGVKVRPVRSEERARAVATLLQRSGALPPIEDEDIEPESDVQDADVVAASDSEEIPPTPLRRK
jgi:hypothetical protein